MAFEQLVNLVHTGELEATDLVWTASMKDWLPAGQVPGLFDAPVLSASTPGTSPPPEPATLPDPLGKWNAQPQTSAETLPEIVPGSDPLDVVACIKRGFELTKRNFPIILLIGITCIGVMLAADFILSQIDSAMGWEKKTPVVPTGPESPPFQYERDPGSPLKGLLSNVLSILISLGTTRIGLLLIAGREVSVGMIFGEGSKLLRAVGASILFAAMMIVGLILFIVPGIYVALRFGFYMTAIVDRNLGVVESLAYSSSITTNNRLNLFVLALLSIAIVIAGLLACFVGLFFAAPIVWMGYLVAYRWLQYGYRAAQDNPDPTTPMAGGI